MKLTFWGVRGSIPTPGPNTVRYGGNTTCLEIRTPSDELIILDGGSGIRELGMKLLGQLPIKANVFISHTHWDHIQGLPFFVPFFIPGQEISIHGTFDPVYQKDLQSILSAQMEYCYFPVRSNELKANITYNDLREQQGVELESAKVCGILMNHPVMTFGYRIDCGEKSIFFTGDHENPTNIYEPDDSSYEEYANLLRVKRGMLVNFIKDVDVIVADAQYTSEEYKQKVGWGHSSYEDCIQLAAEAGAKRLFFTHHDPTRTDAQLDEILEGLLSSGKVPEGLTIDMASEGKEVFL